MNIFRPLLVAGLLLALSSCEGQQHILDTRSAEAARIADLWWIMLVIAVAVSILVTVVLALACWRAVRRHRGEPLKEGAGVKMVVLGGVALPVLVIFPLLLLNYRVGTEVLPPVHYEVEDAVHVEVIGHKFWWEIRYPAYGIVTANEFSIPAGRRVRVDLMAPDVIHSFWVPQLHGKLDMIPGRRNTLWLRADAPGIFRGQCAEFCGTAHALMAIWVEALTEEDFALWIAARAAPRELDERFAVGRAVFIEADCHQCHATADIGLDPIVGQPGPDLSDFASRRFIGAGTIENNRGNLAGWIVNPARIKPGVRMPPSPGLDSPRLQALLDYLESLR